MNSIAQNMCKLVEGNIDPKGWCVLWAKKTQATQFRGNYRSLLTFIMVYPRGGGLRRVNLLGRVRNQFR